MNDPATTTPLPPPTAPDGVDVVDPHRQLVRILDALDTVRGAAEHATENTAGGLVGFDVDGIAYAQAMIAAARASLVMLEDSFTARLVTLFDEADRRWGDVVEVPGVGAITVKKPNRTAKWDHEATARAVIAARMAQTGGEVPDDPDVVADWLLAAAAPAYWRATHLRDDLGINPDAEDDDGERLRRFTRGRPRIDLLVNVTPGKDTVQ